MFSRSLPLCILCKRNPSTTLCQGCRENFCSKCIADHHTELSRDLDNLCDVRNQLFEIINYPSEKANLGFEEIDQWEKEMHENVVRIASKAREQARTFLSESNENVRAELNRISTELHEKQKTGGYIEDDLNRINQQLNNLKDKTQRLNLNINIDTSASRNIDWNSLVRVMPLFQNSTTTYFPTNRNPSNNFSLTENSTINIPHQQKYSNKSSYISPQQKHSNQFTSQPYQINYLPVNSNKNRSFSMNSNLRSYTCIGCKTKNDYNEYGPNICSTCRSPASF